MGALLAEPVYLAVAAIVLGALGTALLLPHRLGAAPSRVQYAMGVLLAIAGVGLFAALWVVPGDVLTRFFFYAFSAVSIVAALLMITSRDPVHSALWFAAVVLSTSA